MSVKYKLYQDTRKTSPNQGKWYARATVSNVATMQSMAEKIERATTVTRSDILAVLSGLSDVMRDETDNITFRITRSGLPHCGRPLF